MCLLGVADLALVAARLRRQELLAEAPGDLAAGGFQCRLGQGDRVGAHVGDETLLVQRLRHPHDLRGREAQAAARLLLQRRGDERGRGASPVRLRRDRRHLGRTPVQSGGQPLCRRLVEHHDAVGGELPVGAEVPARGQAGTVQRADGHRELFAAGRGGGHVQRPVAGGDECHPLPLSLHHDAGRHALHPPGGQARRHLLPQHRRHLVAVEAVQQAPSLLGIHEPAVDVPGVAQGGLDGFGRDLVEHQAPHGHPLRRREHLQQVPGDGLPLAVLVGGEIQLVGGCHELLQLTHLVPLAAAQNVERLEVVLDIDTQARPRLGPVGLGNLRRLRGQVADVPERGLHGVAAAEVIEEAGDRGGLGGRFHDDDPIGCCAGGHDGKPTTPRCTRGWAGNDRPATER